MICENASFARNRGLPFTGKAQKSTFCRKPVLILTHNQQAIRSTAFSKDRRNLMPNAIIRPAPPSEKIFSKKVFHTCVISQM